MLNKINSLSLLCIGCALASLTASAAEPTLRDSPEDAARIKRYLQYPALPRLTEERIDMLPAVAVMCAPPDFHQAKPGSHDKAALHLYANEPAIRKARTWTSDSRFPVGSLLVKEKFETATDATPSIITVMEKVGNKGKIEDWVFSMIRLSDGSLVRERTATSCIDCHERYPETDFVSTFTFSFLTARTKK